MNKSRLLHLFYCGSAVGFGVSATAVSGQFWAVGSLLFAAVLMASTLLEFYVDEMQEWRNRRRLQERAVVEGDYYCMQCGHILGHWQGPIGDLLLNCLHCGTENNFHS